ncbi:MAG: hypothetical protein VW683_00380 [Betaproteobacteria bacterium]|jgi:hypothetical protein
MANIYQLFSANDTVEGNPTEVTTGLWSGDSGSLTSFNLSSTQIATNSGRYYFDVYDKNPITETSAEVQFAIAYGHVSGSGAATLDQSDTTLQAPKAVYLQYKNLLLQPTDSLFTFQSHLSEHIYVINIQRSRLKGKLDPGNFQLNVQGNSGSFSFIDDSLQTLGSRRSFSKSGRVFNLVSGSLTGTSGSTIGAVTSSTGVGFGLVYPDVGVVIVNPDAFVPVVGLLPRSGSGDTEVSVGDRTDLVSGSVGEWTGSISDIVNLYSSNPTANGWAPFTSSLVGASDVFYDQYNHYGMFRAIELGNDFQARSAETISSTHYFIRLGNKQFNYSNNPTFATGSTGKLTNEDFISDPRVFVTTIGLYNQQNELLATAKLSRPLEKSFDKEALIRVRLDF